MNDYNTYLKTIFCQKPNLTIGKTDHSILIGHKDNWVILNNKELKTIQDYISTGIGPLNFDGIMCEKYKKNILLSQAGDIIEINAKLLSTVK